MLFKKQAFVLFLLLTVFAQAARADSGPTIQFPKVGDFSLRLLTPDLLELEFISTKSEDVPPAIWNFVGTNFVFQPPPTSNFTISTGTNRFGIKQIGFKRRVVYAPLKLRDLRIGNWMFLRLERPLPDGAELSLESRDQTLIPGGRAVMRADPDRWSPVIHVNEEGYLPREAKKAFVGYYLGSMGELDLAKCQKFELIDKSGKRAFEGELKPRRDSGFNYEVAPYQSVLEADFTAFENPGEYRILIAGLGASTSFRIDDGYAGILARTFALGLYHQRCGSDNKLPFTRFTHGPCHRNQVEVPDMDFKTVNAVLADMSSNYKNNPRHIAPQLKDVNTCLYPFVNLKKFDASGGHHDAGDYSKYTINVAQLIHVLVFAADAFPGAGDLDNLGLPESGDGKSDLLQEAKWEADFLCKLQDADGGFYFLVYPKERQYEHDVLPDAGDPQVVFPKTTAATAAAVGALAQTASSPLFKKQFPKEAEAYLMRAKRGWAFLEKAFAKYGRDGSYQKITHYGDEFMHDDEIAWAATELYLATGEEKFQKELIEHFDPSKTETKRWNWWRMFESYGCAIRSYAFAVKTGRLAKEKLDDQLFRQCENEIIARAEDLARYADESAYGTSFPAETKRFRNCGWYFSSDGSFDLAVACALDYPIKNDPRARFREALLSNFDYELGANPCNVSYVAGVGWKRPREIVDQYSQNDGRILPPTGLMWGNIQEGFPYLDPYKKELGAITFPPDWHEKNPYPFYDRWGDSFNTTTELVTVNIAKAMAASAYLMGRGPLKSQEWRPSPAQVRFISKTKEISAVEVVANNIDLKAGKCVWEIVGDEPRIISGPNATVQAGNKIEAEVMLPDGRRVFAVGTCPAGSPAAKR